MVLFPGKGLFWVTQDAADYQRQQLNVLRRHQGLPPIAPEYYEPKDGGDFAWSVCAFVGWCFVIYITPILFLSIEQQDAWGAWPWVVSGALVLARWVHKQVQDARDYEARRAAFYRRWRDAGRP
jgi:hypothetical protein